MQMGRLRYPVLGLYRKPFYLWQQRLSRALPWWTMPRAKEMRDLNTDPIYRVSPLSSPNPDHDSAAKHGPFALSCLFRSAGQRHSFE